MISHTVGDVFLDKYELLESVGRGGFGVVFLGRHVRLEHSYAIKLIRADRLGEEGLARFEREIDALSNLNHPNVVRAVDAGLHENDAYIVMEYVDGVSLSQLLRSRKLSIAEVVEIGIQICNGLIAIHGLDRTHRDIKPSNIMIDRSGQVKILDLGLAKLRSSDASQLTVSGEVMGTPDFMAPEQWEDSSAADCRTDIYSLGCTLYALLAGKPPFSGPGYDSAPSKMRGHLLQEPDRLERPDCPAELQAILDRTMSKDPTDRFASLQELAAALEPFRTDVDLAALVAGVCEVADKRDPSMISSSPAALGTTRVPARNQLADLVSGPSANTPAPQPTVRSPATSKRRLLLLGFVLVGLLAGCFVFGEYVVKFVRNEGTLIIANADPENLDINIRKGEVTIVDQGKDRRYVLKASDHYLIEIRDPDGGLKTYSKDFTIVRGQDTVLKAYMEKRKPSVASSKEPSEGVGKADVIRAPQPEFDLQRPFRELEHTAGVTKVAHFDSKVVAGCKDGSLHVWFPQSGALDRKITEHTGIVRAVWASDNGDRLITADSGGLLLVWDRKDWSVYRRAELKTDIWDAKFLDADTVIVSASDGRLRTVSLTDQDVTLGPVINTAPILRELSIIDQNRLVVVGTDSMATIVNATTLEPIKSQKLSEKILTSVVAINDNKIFVGDWAGTTKVWNSITDEVTDRTGTLAVEALATTSGGERIFVGSMYDSGRILEERTASHLELIGAHKGTIADGCFIDDETLITAGLNDQMVRIWKLPPLPKAK